MCKNISVGVISWKGGCTEIRIIEWTLRKFTYKEVKKLSGKLDYDGCTQ